MLTVLPREHSHSKHPLSTTQETTLHINITRWPIPKSVWLFSSQPKMQKFYTVRKKEKQKQELTGAHIMNSLLQNSDLKKCSENHQATQVWPKIPHDYIVEVTNRSKGWDVIDTVPEELWTESHNTVHRKQWSKPSLRKRNAKKGKTVV